MNTIESLSLLAAAVGALGTATPAATPSPITRPLTGGGCADAIVVTLAPSGWRRNENDSESFSPARLKAFRATADAAFRRAADQACATVPAVRRALTSVKRVRVQHAAGATEPTFHRADGYLVFEYAFNETNLETPDRAAIQLGLRCYADPKRRECADQGD